MALSKLRFWQNNMNLMWYVCATSFIVNLPRRFWYRSSTFFTNLDSVCISVADPGCVYRIRILTRFFPSRIQGQKGIGSLIRIRNTELTENENIFNLTQNMKKTKSPRIWFGMFILDSGSQIRICSFPDPDCGPRVLKSSGSVILDRNISFSLRLKKYFLYTRVLFKNLFIYFM